MAVILSLAGCADYGSGLLQSVDLQGEIERFLQSGDNCHNYARSTPP
jgi:hypothetical protein